MKRSGASRRRGTIVAVAALVMLALGCSSWRHGSTVATYEGQVLRVHDGGPGAERLATEAAYDVTIRHFVAQNGEPDYVYVVDRFSVQLMYLADDRIVFFQRSTWNPKSQATVTEGIPRPLASLFSRADQERLDRTRAARHVAGP